MQIYLTALCLSSFIMFYYSAQQHRFTFNVQSSEFSFFKYISDAEDKAYAAIMCNRDAQGHAGY